MMKALRNAFLLALCGAALLLLISCKFTSLGEDVPEESKHEHTYGEWEQTIDPTCEGKGLRVRVCECGEDQIEYILPLGHTAQRIFAVAPTCTEGGFGEGKECVTCRAILEEPEKIPPAGHTPSEWVVQKEATCISEGSQYRTCTVCEKQLDSNEIPATGHSASDWYTEQFATCLAEGVRYRECTICAEELERETIPMTEHEISDWLVESEATCVTLGVRRRVCGICGEEMAREESPMTDHVPSEWRAEQPPTCTEPGYVVTACKVCGETLFMGETVPPIGHMIIQGLCTEPTRCVTCGEIFAEATGHSTSAGVCEWCGQTINELFLFAATVYAEAAGQNALTKSAVAHTMYNRIGVKEWKKYTTITAVITQPYQFSGYNNAMYHSAYVYYETGVHQNEIERVAMDECLAICRAILEGEVDFTGGATFFHSLEKPEDWKYHASYTLLTVEGTEGFWFYV